MEEDEVELGYRVVAWEWLVWAVELQSEVHRPWRVPQVQRLHPVRVVSFCNASHAFCNDSLWTNSSHIDAYKENYLIEGHCMCTPSHGVFE